MKIELIPESGHWYRVNLHCHTTISDGHHTPEQIKDIYKKAGYHAVCYTDHEVLIGHEDLCDKDFIALHGYEVAIKQNQSAHTGYFMPVYHLNLVARRQDNLCMTRFYRNNPSFPGNAKEWIDKAQYRDISDEVKYDQGWLNDYIRDANDAGFLVLFNHPQWSLQNLSDMAKLEGLCGIELINGGCYWHNDRTSVHFEQMLRAGKRILPIGGDDTHDDAHLFLGWTMLKAPSLTYDNLIAALDAGDCYASDGPEIHSLVLEDGVIRLKCSEAVCVTLFAEGRYLESYHEAGKTYTDVSFAYRPEHFGSYFRIEVRDEKGRCAYSNAYYTKDLPTC